MGLLLLFACAKRDAQPSAPPPPPPSAAPIAAAPDSSAAWYTARAVGELKSRATLAAWMASHQLDELAREDRELWCAQTTLRTLLPGGRIVTRRAQFFLVDVDPDSVRQPGYRPDPGQQCVVGYIEVLVQAAIPAHEAVIDSLHNELVRVFAGTERPQADFGAGDLHFQVSQLASGEPDDPEPTDTVIVRTWSATQESARDLMFEPTLPATGRVDSLEHALLDLDECQPPTDSLLHVAEHWLEATHDSTERRELHYLVAEIYTDHLQLVNATGDRLEAMKHLRAALALEQRSPSGFARRAAAHLWRLAYGMRLPGLVFGGECGD